MGYTHTLLGREVLHALVRTTFQFHMTINKMMWAYGEDEVLDSRAGRTSLRSNCSEVGVKQIGGSLELIEYEVGKSQLTEGVRISLNAILL